MTEEKRKLIDNRILLILGVSIFLIILVGCAIMFVNYADEKSYTGEFITANKVYMPDNNIKLVIYFNESDGDIHFKIFDGWDARHSILLSNMDMGDRVKICYKDYAFRDCREIIRIEEIK